MDSLDLPPLLTKNNNSISKTNLRKKKVKKREHSSDVGG